MREKGQTEVAKTLETPVFSRGIEILTEKLEFIGILLLQALRFILCERMKKPQPDGCGGSDCDCPFFVQMNYRYAEFETFLLT